MIQWSTLPGKIVNQRGTLELPNLVLIIHLVGIGINVSHDLELKRSIKPNNSVLTDTDNKGLIENSSIKENIKNTSSVFRVDRDLSQYLYIFI